LNIAADGTKHKQNDSSLIVHYKPATASYLPI